MTTITEGARNAEFLFSEANGDRSRDVVTLKGGAVYASGELVASEEVDGVPTGLYATADENASSAALVYLRTDATDGPVEAAVIASEAEVIDSLIVLGAGVTAEQGTEILARSGIKVRSSL